MQIVMVLFLLNNMFVADTTFMGWKKLLLTAGIFILIPAYFLYTPILDGYSTMSTCKIQFALAAMKTIGGLVGIALGVTNGLDIHIHYIVLLAFWLLTNTDCIPVVTSRTHIQPSMIFLDNITILFIFAQLVSFSYTSNSRMMMMMMMMLCRLKLL